MTQKTEKIGLNGLKALLTNEKTYRGCTFIGFDMLTTVELKGGKSNPHKGRVTKVHMGYSGMLFSNKVSSAYGDMVNRRLKQENKEINGKLSLKGYSSFEPSALPWGVRVPNTAVIEHKDNTYLQIIYTQRAKSLMDFVTKELGIQLHEGDAELIEALESRVVEYKTQGGNVRYFLDGKPIAKEEIIGLPDRGEGEQGGLSDEMKVIVRSPKLSSLVRLTIGGTNYLIED